MSSGDGLPNPHPSLHLSVVNSVPVRPNILLVIADDHQADAIGALGPTPVHTPTLDRLVHQGTTFTRARIMGSLMPAVCAPSRACLLTGRNLFAADANPTLNRGPDFQVTLPPNATTLPQRFREVGYESFLSGKWHNDLPSLLRSFERGAAIFHGGMCDHKQVPVRDLEGVRRGDAPRVATGFSTELFFGATEDFLRQRDRRRPFFAWVGLTSPHDPRTPPPEFRALYDAKKLPLPENFLPDHPFDNGELGVRDEQLVGRPISPEALREQLAAYYGMISHQDACLGRVLEALRETGEDRNTIVVYLSDHGLALGRHGLVGKQNLYEHSIRVPLILSGPGIPRGVKRATLAYSFDLYATLCELTGLRPAAELDSRSLVPAFKPEARATRDSLCAAYMDCQRMATDGRWKLILYQVGGNERHQLFDLQTDPGELHDVSGDPTQRFIVERLLITLRDWQETIGDRWMRSPLLGTAAPLA